MSRIVSYLPLLVALVGCGDPIKHVELIEEPRVLAARAEVMGAPERATPSPGETLQVRWLVAAPEGDPVSGFALAACSAPKTTRGSLRCESAPFASDVSDANAANPQFDLSVPAELDAEAHPRLAILGSLCANGTGRIEGQTADCSSGSELPVALDLMLAGSERTNLNPNFATDAITLGGSPWLASELPSAGCSGSGLPEVSRGAGKAAIQISLPDSAREALVQHSSADAQREALRISHFSSAGELERPFSEVLPDTTQATISVDWQPPKTAPAEGQLVRFWFVVRDLRGGSDFTERAFCLLP